MDAVEPGLSLCPAFFIFNYFSKLHQNVALLKLVGKNYTSILQNDFAVVMDECCSPVYLGKLS
jgi:hypothetical protein